MRKGQKSREEWRKAWLERKRVAPEEDAVDLVEETETGLVELQNSIKQRASQEQDRRTAATDSRYWVALCFQTREQKDEFLRRMRIDDLGDIYLDGAEVAERLGVPLEAPGPEWKDAPIKKKLADLT